MYPFLRFLLIALAVILSSATRTVDADHAPIVPGVQNLTTQNEVRTLATGSRTDRKISFAERVAHQRAIEDVYWHHRTWPNAVSKPSLDKAMSTAQIEKKVEYYLRSSMLVEADSHRSINAEQLQAEMNRMASSTKQPELLRELFAALGNDPFAIAECLARPILVERLRSELPAAIQIANVPLGQVAATNNTALTTLHVSSNYTLPVIGRPPTAYPDAILTNINNVPSPRANNTLVWTGTEMIVWGGVFAGRGLFLPFNTGARYSPSTDSWTPTSTEGAPAARYFHTAVWTGTEMVVWGGLQDEKNYLGFNNGGRYNPSTDTWAAISTTTAPEARFLHTAVWIGNEMIVWGGAVGPTFAYLNTGGRYDPAADTWTATSLTDAPMARGGHAAIWTGDEMIVWGGVNVTDLNTGGQYNPGTDSWIGTSTSNAPILNGARAVWAGSEMLVWGGTGMGFSSMGGRYDPSADSWSPISTANSPVGISSRIVWSGREMIVWGGNIEGGDTNTGGRYDPATDIWEATSIADAPSARAGNSAVWTDSEMIVWGGIDNSASNVNSGGRYNPGADSWTATQDITSQITPGGTTCSQISSGTADDLANASYRVDANGNIKGVNPGTFVYWVRTPLLAGRKTVLITQSITTGNFSTLFKLDQGSSIFTSSDCQAITGASFKQSTTNGTSSTVTVKFNAPSSNIYYIAIKFATSNLRQKSSPLPTAVHYDVSTMGVSGSTRGFDLIKQ